LKYRKIKIQASQEADISICRTERLRSSAGSGGESGSILEMRSIGALEFVRMARIPFELDV
jgi:hypothetical protein